MFEVTKYTNEKKAQWDAFVATAKNSTFLFYRDYIDYHADRFVDSSLMIYRKGKIFALLPANIVGDTIYSHQGLTYGGLLINEKATVVDVLSAFEEINQYLKLIGVNKVIYKPLPHIYHQIPAEEDLYALFRVNARLVARNISSTIYRDSRLKFVESRKSGLRKAIRSGICIKECNDFHLFWEILSNNLNAKYNTKPVHSLDEIRLLQSRFPEQIRLYMAFLNSKPLAGVLLYLSKNVCHTQYISASYEGKELGALDLMFDKLINELYADYPIFDFGQSTELGGTYLNENLIFQKEGFGGRGIAYDIYEYTI